MKLVSPLRAFLGLGTLCALLFVSTPSVFASEAGVGAGGGGSDIALKFISETESAISFVTARPNVFPEYQKAGIRLEDVLTRASKKLTVSKESIFVKADNLLQESSAKSEILPSGEFAITLNGNVNSKVSIYSITDDKILSALGLHELSVLLGIEKTGDYHVSERYLKRLGVVCRTGICAPDPSGILQVYMTATADKIYNIPGQNSLVFENPRFELSTPVSVDNVPNVSNLKIYRGYDVHYVFIWGHVQKHPRETDYNMASVEAFCQIFGAKAQDATLIPAPEGTPATVFDPDAQNWGFGALYKMPWGAKWENHFFYADRIICTSPEE